MTLLARDRRMADLTDEITREIKRQDLGHPRGYPKNREGVRAGLAAIEDELDEAKGAWRSERCKCKEPECAHSKYLHTRYELVQVAAVAIRAARELG